MIGIYDCFGYGPGYDVPFEERYRLIKRAGFDCVMLGGATSSAAGPVIRRTPASPRTRDCGLRTSTRPFTSRTACPWTISPAKAFIKATCNASETARPTAFRRW